MERTIEAHDRNQLELKLDYSVDPSLSRQRYRVETFLFIPESLGIHGSSYPANRFYDDTAAYIRLQTPKVALRALGTLQDEPWLTSCREILDTLLKGNRDGREEAVQRLKMLGCIFRSALRDEAAVLAESCRRLEQADSGARTAKREAIAVLVERFIKDVAAALARLESLGIRAEQAAVPTRVAATWRAVDEYVSLSAEESMTMVVVAIDRVTDADEEDRLVQLRHRLASATVDTYRYRRGKGYPSFVRPGCENEALPYQRRLLKKVISSVLYLDVERDSRGDRWSRNVVGGVAAATAMAFAVVATIVATIEFGTTSLAFMAVAIASYIVKDRIKELGRGWLGGHVQRYLPDHRVLVRDRETGVCLGKASETVRTVPATRIEPSVRRARHAQNPGIIARDARPETVVHWTKDVTLESSALTARDRGGNAIHDLVRFNIHRLRRRMDDPHEMHRIVEPTTRRIRDVRCARVYHMNVILRLTYERDGEKLEEIDHVRVVMDQRGIQRVEAVRAPTPRAIQPAAKLALSESA